MVEWVRIHLPMQVRFLVLEDFTCLGATKPMHCNSETHEPELLSLIDATMGACATRAFLLQRDAVAVKSLHAVTRVVPTLHN